jgi:hypothetical protein
MFCLSAPAVKPDREPMTDLAVAALVRKRAELAGEIEARLAEIDRLQGDLVHLDATIRIMCPDAEPELIKPKRPSRKGCDWFGRGELGRLVLDALRSASEPLGSMAIARAVMEYKGMVAADAVALRRVENMVDGALRRREGRLVDRIANGRTLEWRLSGLDHRAA